MTEPPPQQIGRLALREIRDEVRAYYAMPDTMKGAILLGTIKRTVVQGRPERFEQWRLLLQEAIGDIIEGISGKRPVWPNQPVVAPEHERGKEPWKGDS